MNRRGFLFGSVAVPVGAVLPPALAAELALPPPKLTPETRLIVPPINRGAVMYLSDLIEGKGRITILDDDGAVVGSYAIHRVSSYFPHVDMVFGDFLTARRVQYGPREISMEMTQVDWS